MTTIDPTPITASLVAHNIDPATAEIVDGRTNMGNGAITVTIRSPKPTRQARMWRTGEWALKVSGRYVEDSAGEVLLWGSAGAALQAVGRMPR